jgi:hypothetical protein
MTILGYLCDSNAKKLKEAQVTMNQLRITMDSTFGVKVSGNNGKTKPKITSRVC